MHARSALFDVYGDLLPSREHRATVAALVRLLEPVGIAPPAVRTAVSRMVSQGWLEPVRLAEGRGYAATDRAVVRLAEAARRIYRRPLDWDGKWHLVLLQVSPSSPTPARTVRNRAHRQLGYLGYAPLRDGVWVSPHRSPEVADALAGDDVTATTAVVDELDPPDAAVAAWDLPALHAAYEEWLAGAADRLEADLAGDDDAERAAYAARFHLVHEWRKFLFVDPRLPDSLLPTDWAGHRAGAFFAEQADRLQGPADAFVARVLADS